jgi:hypothetical protein
MVIELYNSNVTLTPTTLVAAGASKSSIRLNWTDNSGDENGFEIWRAPAANGTYSLVATTAANATTYTDGGLGDNQWYFYKVRAKSATQFSSYSNVASASTLSYVVYQNFNVDLPAASPWNNTNSLPEDYALFDNLMNDQGNLSGVSITIVNNFSGTNPNGMVTGNNSGVVPDNVMRASYYTGKGVTARLRVDGLSQVSKYNFVFFASRDGSGDRTTLYTINGQTVALNAAFNTMQTAQINGVVPDENGSVFIDMINGPASQFGYLNGMIIQGYGAMPVGNTMGGLNSLTMANTGAQAVTAQAASPERDRSIGEQAGSAGAVNVYPNPFQDAVTVQLAVADNLAILSVKITDLSGRVISLQRYRNIPAGIWQQRISLQGLALNPGTYFIQLDGVPGQRAQTVKILKIK